MVLCSQSDVPDTYCSSLEQPNRSLTAGIGTEMDTLVIRERLMAAWSGGREREGPLGELIYLFYSSRLSSIEFPHCGMNKGLSYLYKILNQKVSYRKCHCVYFFFELLTLKIAL